MSEQSLKAIPWQSKTVYCVSVQKKGEEIS